MATRDRPSRVRGPATVVLAVVAAGLVVPITPAAAAPACATIRQLTRSPGPPIIETVLSSDGRRLAFVAEADLTGGNADGNQELFLLDLATNDLEQLTTSTGGQVDGPTLSGDGMRIAWSENRNELGTNADLTYEIFVHDVATGVTTQVTNTAGNSLGPWLSADGTRLAYASDIDGNYEVYLYDSATDETAAVTETAVGDSFDPVMSADGTLIVFESDADLVGANADGTSEIFLYDVAGDELTQITSAGVGDSMFPALSGDGSTVTFSSFADLLGTNADANLELFLYDVVEEELEQVSVTTTGTTTGNDLSYDGSRVVMNVTSDLLGPTPLDWENVLWHRPTDTFVQLTDTPGAITAGAAISGDGTQIVTRTRANLLGGNPDGGWDLYLTTCGSSHQTFVDVPVAHTFFDQVEWMAASKVSEGYGDGTYRPALPVSRGAMSAFLYRLAGSPDVDAGLSPAFPDVPTAHPFYEAIQWMDDTGLSTGFSDGTYRPALPVSRGAMSAFLYRLAGSPAVDAGLVQAFPDVPPGHTFYTPIQWASLAGISGGFPDDTYRPELPVSRGSMSAFMHRLAAGPGVGL